MTWHFTTDFFQFIKIWLEPLSSNSFFFKLILKLVDISFSTHFTNFWLCRSLLTHRSEFLIILRQFINLIIILFLHYFTVWLVFINQIFNLINLNFILRLLFFSISFFLKLFRFLWKHAFGDGTLSNLTCRFGENRFGLRLSDRWRTLFIESLNIILA